MSKIVKSMRSALGWRAPGKCWFTWVMYHHL